MSKVKVTMRKYMGDDRLSWAVFRNDQREPVVTGLSIHEARMYRRYIDRLANQTLEEKRRILEQGGAHGI